MVDKIISKLTKEVEEYSVKLDELLGFTQERVLDMLSDFTDESADLENSYPEVILDMLRYWTSEFSNLDERAKTYLQVLDNNEYVLDILRGGSDHD